MSIYSRISLYAAAASVCFEPAWAQTQPDSSSDQLREVIVSAQRTSENLQAVPIAVQSATAEQLKDIHVQSYDDLVNIVPSLHFNASGPVMQPFLRGIGSTVVAEGAEASVAEYVDGVYYASQHETALAFNNIQSVEVDKGPQGTLFGRNATAGVIQIITKDPSQAPSLDLEGGYGNFNTWTGKLYVTGGLAPRLAADLAVVDVQQNEGWGTNLFNGGPAYANSSFGLRSKILWTPTDTTRVTLTYDYERERFNSGAAPRFTNYSPCLLPAGQTQVFCSTPFYDFNLDLYNPGVKTIDTGVALKAEQELGWATLTNIASYRHSRSVSRIDADVTSARLLQAQLVAPDDTYTEELQLHSPTGTRLKWIVGLFYYNDTSKYDPQTVFGVLFGPGLILQSQMKTRSYAGYGQATYSIREDTRLTAGVRYTVDRREVSGTEGLSTTPEVVLATQGPADHVQYSTPTWRASFDHDLTSAVMAYAAVSTGFKSGTFNAAALNTPAVRPEKLTSYEVGLKNELFDRRLRLNLDAFYYDYKDIQLNKFVGATTLLQNAAKAKVKGIEVEAAAKATQNLTVTFNASYLNARYTSFPNAPFYTPLALTDANPALSGPPGSGLTTFGGYLQSQRDLSGRDMILAAPVSGNLGATYNMGLPDGSNLTFAGNVYGTSKFYFDPQNISSQYGYFTIGSSVKWTARNGKWDASVWGSNLTDRQIYAGLNVSTAGATAFPAAPRMFGVTVGAHL